MQGVGRGLLPALAALIVAALPFFVQAQVSINEIMYNPAGADTGREWIELYNAGGSDVTMVGGTVKGSWRISDGSNHTLIDPSGGTGRGSLTIPAGGYLIIANDPTDFESGEYAGGSYSVVKSSISLSNAGATVTLTDGSGNVVDSVSYTSTQGGSDDGSSLQKQADGSWIAALPTPGAANSTTPFVAPTDDQDASDTAQTSSTTTTQTKADSYVPPPAPSLYADAGGDKIVIVGADVEFDGFAYDKDQNQLDDTTTRFMWNFGDGATAEGESVEHHFDYPGTYAVVLSVANNKFAVADTATVVAEPAALSFTVMPDGGVSIENLAGHDLDLSDWIVQQSSSPFAAQFILPEHSVILAGTSMHIGAETLTFKASSDSSLEYPNGVVALGAGETTQPASTAVLPIVSTSTPAAEPAVNMPAASSSAPQPSASDGTSDATTTDDSIASDDLDDSPPALLSEPTSTFATSSQTAAAADGGGTSYWWWAAAGLLALLGAGAMIAGKRIGAREWDIIEEKE